MHNRSILRLSLVVAIVLLSGSAVVRAQGPNGSVINFTVSMPKPWTHLLEVEMRVQVPASLNVANDSNLIMPVWTPGSYLIREFEKNVQDFAADAGGRPLEWTKLNKNTWSVKTNGARQWRVFYRVYANEFSVRTNELNADHAFWNNAALLMYPEGGINQPSTLTVIAPQGWKIATGLPPATNAAVNPGANQSPANVSTFQAENFDILYDSPFEVSNFKQIDFDVRGVPHRIVIDGEGNYDPERMKRDVQKIVEAEVGMFDVIPYHDYTFILHLRANTGGGIEHLNSTSLGFVRNRFGNERGWRSFHSLVAHEFFHLWNVKRIRPDALGPFDYTKENYTRSLWVAEGITSYYGDLMVRRAGLISDKEYLDGLARAIQDYQGIPGRLEMSAEEASFNTWIKEYRPDENSVNSQISYYDKGELLGLLLDLEIRRQSNNAKSLDDVMRYLYHEFYEKNRNYSPADFQKACELMAGSSLEEFFTHYVRGRDEMPYNQFLSAAGLGLDQPGQVRSSGGGNKLVGYLGADLEDSGDFINVRDVRAGSPAYEQGLNARDKIVALNGMHLNKEAFEAVIAAKVEETVRITVLRNEDLRTLEIKLGAKTDAPDRMVQLPSTTDQQKRVYQSWLNGR
ncbi:MAG TPA: PDZ domain-containing protein [Pyrinomonadaceae bacterium]|nr:PDZ domain-containing protein [Pyrinomonadaceae bacterium]